MEEFDDLDQADIEYTGEEQVDEEEEKDEGGSMMEKRRGWRALPLTFSTLGYYSLCFNNCAVHYCSALAVL